MVFCPLHRNNATRERRANVIFTPNGATATNGHRCTLRKAGYYSHSQSILAQGQTAGKCVPPNILTSVSHIGIPPSTMPNRKYQTYHTRNLLSAPTKITRMCAIGANGDTNIIRGYADEFSKIKQIMRIYFVILIRWITIFLKISTYKNRDIRTYSIHNITR